MSNQLRWITLAVATGVAALAMGQASAQNYASSDYGHGNGYGYGHSRTIRCESNNSRRTWCRADAQGGVRIARQLSHSACIAGSSWGSNDRGVWVSNGCRADFAIYSRRDYHHHYDGYNNYGYNDRNGYSNGDSRYVDSNGQAL